MNTSTPQITPALDPAVLHEITGGVWPGENGTCTPDLPNCPPADPEPFPLPNPCPEPDPFLNAA